MVKIWLFMGIFWGVDLPLMGLQKRATFQTTAYRKNPKQKMGEIFTLQFPNLKSLILC